MARRINTTSTIIELNYKLVTKVPKRELAEWVSKRIETLGPTYIKIGQFVSSRKDIFGEEFAEALSTLRDKVKPMEEWEVQQVMSSSLDMTKFDHFDMRPVASASIGQVHKATLTNGKNVIVKIKRPNVGEMIKEDVGFILMILSFLQFFNLENIQDSIDIINDFEKNISKEVNFVDEVNSLRHFRDIYAKDNFKAVIPRVYRKLSSDNAIVMEYVESQDVASFNGNRKELATRLMDFFIYQLVNHGYIHGDPHAGNIGTNDDGEIVLYDFGNVLTVSDAERQRLKELIYFLLVQNKKGIVNTLKKLGIKVTDEKLMYEYIDGYIEYLRTIDITKLSAANGPRIKLPLKLNDKVFRITRVYGLLEGICKDLDPDFNYIPLFNKYSNEVFFDEEFLLYKIVADTATLVNNMLDPMEQQVDSEPVQETPVVPTELVDKHIPVIIDNKIWQVLVGFNAMLFVWNVFHMH